MSPKLEDLESEYVKTRATTDFLVDEIASFVDDNRTSVIAITRRGIFVDLCQ